MAFHFDPNVDAAPTLSSSSEGGVVALSPAPLGEQRRPSRPIAAARRLGDWRLLARFCAVGALGYVVNLAAYAGLLRAGADFRIAAVCSFLVAVSHNYLLNRRWTFAAFRGGFARQGGRFFAVSATALGLNILMLSTLAALGVERLPSQAAAIILVTPVSFLGNRLWSFALS